MFEFEHYKNVYEIGGFYIAHSKEELSEYINRYLMDPTIHANERALTLKQQVRFCDGDNYLRVVAAIKQA